jgi:hypothetical protein
MNIKIIFLMIFIFNCPSQLTTIYASSNTSQSDNTRKDESVTVDHTHANFNAILQKVVIIFNQGAYTQIDYQKVDRKKLNTYIDQLLSVKKAEVDSWTKNQQLAFYFNLYNALTIELILKNYPLKSIKDLGSGFPLFQSPWKKKFFNLFGELSHLDRIEHELTRGNPNLLDPLVHLGFNCASIGCPALLNEAFNADNLEPQLDQATKNFLKDRTRHYVQGDTLYVSSIFDWYQSDFEKGIRGFNNLHDFFYYYKESLADNDQQLRVLNNKKFKISFLTYDWNLNDKKP